MADALKAEGNKLFAEKKFAESIDKFSKAIDVDSSNHVLYSNRSGAHASMKTWDKALDDAVKATELKPDWAKGWSRKGAALHGAGQLPAAQEAFQQALELDPNNAQAKSGLDAATRALETGDAGADTGIGSMFNDPNMLQKLMTNPKTAPLLADKDFMDKLQRLRANPNEIGLYLQDPRFLQVMSVLLGVDMQMRDPSDTPGASASEDVLMTDAPSQSTKEPEPEPEPVSETDEEIAAREAKAKAEEEKKKGTEFYKKRQFDEAIEHYTKAWELHKDIAFLTNLGAAKFEKGDFHGCIETCQQAVDHGREMLADFKMIAKAFARTGTAYEKLGDLSNAVLYYTKAQTEHRTPEVLAKLRAAEKAKANAEKEAYVDPAEAEKARELGNERFKAADWPGAVEAYSEWIKRAPDDARGYSNRAACFVKLLSFPSAVQDCDEAIKRDASFVRAYLRKAQAYFAMREYNKCVDACNDATEHDVDGKNKREIEQQTQRAYEAMYAARQGETEAETMERVQRDPEIVSILSDPVMQSILQQAKDNPAALSEHLKNAEIRNKMQKLVAAGVVRTSRT